MDTQAVLDRLKAEPGYEENARHFREIIDASEARDADALAKLVDDQFTLRVSPTAVGALKRKNRNRLPNR